MPITLSITKSIVLEIKGLLQKIHLDATGLHGEHVWQNWVFLFTGGFCAELSQSVIQKSCPYCSLLKIVKINGLLKACQFGNTYENH